MYKITYSKLVKKDLKKIQKNDLNQIIKKIKSLAIDPFPVGATILRGEGKMFRVRQGDYRIIYKIQNQELIVLIVKVGHRSDVYRNMN